MTKIQKSKHIESIKQIIEANGFTQDRWGKYVKGKHKIEIGDNNLKVFAKGESKWHNIWGKPMTGLALEEVEKRIKSL